MEDILTSSASADLKGEVASVCRKFLDVVQRTAILNSNADILSNIYKFSGKVSGRSGFHRRINQTFTRPVGRVEIVKYVQTVAIRCRNWWNEDFAALLRLQPNNRTDLRKRVFPCARTAIRHDMYWAEAFHCPVSHLFPIRINVRMNFPWVTSLNKGGLYLGQVREHCVLYFRNCIQPDTNLFVFMLFAFGCRGTIKEGINLFPRLVQQFVSIVRCNVIRDTGRNATQRRIFKSELLYFLKYLGCGACAQLVETAMDQSR